MQLTIEKKVLLQKLADALKQSKADEQAWVVRQRKDEIKGAEDAVKWAERELAGYREKLVKARAAAPLPVRKSRRTTEIESAIKAVNLSAGEFIKLSQKSDILGLL